MRLSRADFASTAARKMSLTHVSNTMTTADKVFKTLLSSIKDETGVEPPAIQRIYDEVTTLRFSVEQPLGLVARWVQRPIDGRFKPQAGDKFLEDGLTADLASAATAQALQSADDTLRQTVQSGQMPTRTDGAYQRFAARFWHLAPCATCAGQPVGACHSCEGERHFACTTCRGTARVSCSCDDGRIRCARCNGTGTRSEQSWEYRRVEITHPDAPTQFKSEQVDIKKQVSCGCDNGYNRCPHCIGSGKLACPASACLGGRTACTACQGSGDAPPCQPCEGTGATGTLHEGAVHLDWGKTRITLPTKMSDVEQLVRSALGTDSRLLRESTTTVNQVSPAGSAALPHALVVTQDARLKIIRVDVDFSGKTYQVVAYGAEPSLATDGGLQSRLAAPIRQQRATAHDKAKVADTINQQGLMTAVNSLAAAHAMRAASSQQLQSALQTSMQSVYFKEEVNWLLSDPVQSQRYFSGYRLRHGDDHHRFRTSFMFSVERIFLNLKRHYITVVLLCIAAVVGLGIWLGSPLMAGVIGLVMTSARLHNRLFNKLLFQRFQGIFESPEQSLTTFKGLLCSEAVFSSAVQQHQKMLAEPGRTIRFRGLFLMIGLGLVVLVTRHGAAGALVQVKGWGLTLLRWIA